MKTVYLAGPISGQSYNEATDWRDLAKDFLEAADIEVRTPMRDKLHLSASEELPRQDASRVLCRAPSIVARDFNDLRAADLVLANLLDTRRISIGTLVELGYAAALGKPVVVVLSLTDPAYTHPFVLETAAAVVETLEEGLLTAASFLNCDTLLLRERLEEAFTQVL